MLLTDPILTDDGTILAGTLDNCILGYSWEKMTSWKYKANARVRYPPAVNSQGLICALGDDNTLHFLESAGNGTEIMTGFERSTASASVGPDDTIYIPTYEYLHAVTPGSILWSLPLDLKYSCYLAVSSDNVVYAVSGENMLNALSNEGEFLWSMELGYEINSSPVIAENGTIYITISTDDGSYLVALDTNGGEIWRFMFSDVNRFCYIVVSNERIYIAQYPGPLYAIGQGLSDTKPPEVNILTPLDSSVVTGTYQVQISARDQYGINSVELSINNGEWKKCDDIGKYWVYPLDTREYDKGSNLTIIARAIDNSPNKNVSYTEEIEVEVDIWKSAYWVDVDNSRLDADGSLNNPYPAITQALENGIFSHYDNVTIRIKSGFYNISTGEVFPLILKSNTTLSGESKYSTFIEADIEPGMSEVSGIFCKDASNVIIENLSIRGGTGTLAPAG